MSRFVQQGTITAVFWSGEGYLCDLKKRHCVFNNNNTEKNVKNICFDMKRERYHVASDINGCKCHCPHKGKGVANVENEYYKCKNGKNEKGDFYVPMFDCIDDCKGKKAATHISGKSCERCGKLTFAQTLATALNAFFELYFLDLVAQKQAQQSMERFVKEGVECGKTASCGFQIQKYENEKGNDKLLCKRKCVHGVIYLCRFAISATIVQLAKQAFGNHLLFHSLSVGQFGEAVLFPDCISGRKPCAKIVICCSRLAEFGFQAGAFRREWS